MKLPDWADKLVVFVEPTNRGKWRCALWATTGFCRRWQRMIRRYFPTKFDAEEQASLWQEKYKVDKQDVHYTFYEQSEHY